MPNVPAAGRVGVGWLNGTRTVFRGSCRSFEGGYPARDPEEGPSDSRAEKEQLEKDRNLVEIY